MATIDDVMALLVQVKDGLIEFRAQAATKFNELDIAIKTEKINHSLCRFCGGAGFVDVEGTVECIQCSGIGSTPTGFTRISE